jgi:LacI family transcriptional regulator
MKKRRAKTTTVTLADVAKTAQVATMTVSRYLNGHPNVTERTAGKIKAAIEQLGYRPNQAARMLMGQPSRVIGLIIPNLANPFFSSIAHSVQQTAHAHGYLVWIAATDDEKSMDLQLIQRMRDHHVDGILLTAAPKTSLHQAELGDVPVVAVDRMIPGKLVDSVIIEDRVAAREAVRHLLEHSYRRIACLGLDPGINSIRERILGYQEAMRARKLVPLPYAHCEDRPSTVRVLRKLLSGRAPVQAIFPAGVVATTLALEALDELEYTVPEKVALFSFGDAPLFHVFHPQISAVQQPTATLGETATLHLLHLISRKARPSGMSIRIPASLVLRESCGCGR